MEEKNQKEITVPNHSRMPQTIEGNETLPDVFESRILIIGSRLSGSFELSEIFQRYLEQQGIPEPSVEPVRDVAMIDAAIFGDENIGRDGKKPKLPKGIILLPEARQYISGRGQTIDSYESGLSSRVEDICKKLNIPLVKVRKNQNLDRRIESGIKKLLETGD